MGLDWRLALVAGLLLLLGLAVQYLIRTFGPEGYKKMVDEYERDFPGMCGHCGYSRFIRRETGRSDKPPPHWCVEKGRFLQ